jgi:hypothetical protein
MAECTLSDNELFSEADRQQLTEQQRDLLHRLETDGRMADVWGVLSAMPVTGERRRELILRVLKAHAAALALAKPLSEMSLSDLTEHVRAHPYQPSWEHLAWTADQTAEIAKAFAAVSVQDVALLEEASRINIQLAELAQKRHRELVDWMKDGAGPTPKRWQFPQVRHSSFVVAMGRWFEKVTGKPKDQAVATLTEIVFEMPDSMSVEAVRKIRSRADA